MSDAFKNKNVSWLASIEWGMVGREAKACGDIAINNKANNGSGEMKPRRL